MVGFTPHDLLVATAIVIVFVWSFINCRPLF